VGILWSEFVIEAGELASEISGVIERYRFALIGNIRRDGTPRISPVETHVVDHDLAVVMLPQTRKAEDVRRDERVTLQSPITNAADPGAEYKLRGRGVTVNSDAHRQAIADAVDGRVCPCPSRSALDRRLTFSVSLVSVCALGLTPRRVCPMLPEPRPRPRPRSGRGGSP